MNEKEMLEKQKQVAELMKNLEKNPQEALKKLLELQQIADREMDKESAEYYSVTVAIQESMGDCHMKLKQIPDAEKAYQEGVRKATKLYEADRSQNDYRLGGAYYKLAAFYRALIGCNMMLPKPKELTEPQKKVFQIAEQCYKNAVGCTMDNAKKGSGRHIEFHANCFGELLVLYAAVGDYEHAIPFGKDAVHLSKVLYEKKDDKVYAFRLANQMNGLAAVYMFSKNSQLAMESMEDAVYVLEEHEEEDPVGLGITLARYYISLGSCYCAVEEEKMNAEEAYKKGLDRMEKLNGQSKNRLIDDLIQSYVFVGDYYQREKKTSEANDCYKRAMKLSADMWKVTKNPKYDNLVKNLQSKV